MEIIRQMQERKDLTERERNIRDYLMEHPEAVISMTAKQLGEVSYSSTAAVSRFAGNRLSGLWRIPAAFPK